MRAELRNSAEWAASTTFNNVWNATYGNLMNIRQMIEKSRREPKVTPKNMTYWVWHKLWKL